ncbi:MAG: hypothetical protein ACREMA_05875 [Longimicrobiales bacterium]
MTPEGSGFTSQQLLTALHRAGLSIGGVQQALRGDIVSSPSDRAVIAKMLAAFVTLAANDKLEHYDFPGEYAQRFDGVDTGKPVSPGRPTPTTNKTR